MAEPKIKILVVDDEPHILKVIRSRLMASGYEVETANGGLEALERVAEAPPHLILLDIVMPDLDGYEVCKRLKAREETRGIPVVVVTAAQQKELAQKCLKAGATDLILKPFEAGALLEMIESVLAEVKGEGGV